MLMTDVSSRLPSAFKGFSLLEVLVSLVIMSVSLVVIFQTLSGATRLAVQREERQEAIQMLQSILQDQELLKEAAAQTEITDAVRHAPDWHYHIQAHALMLETEDDLEELEIPAMQRLEVCVFHTDTARPRRLCAETWYREF